MPELPLISLIVPCYNEAQSLPALHSALAKLVSSLPYRFEFILVDDGSTDDSRPLLRQMVELDSRVEAVFFVRNFGKEAAVSAGLHLCQGEAAIMLDADLQHPVELIPEFLSNWTQGHDVVVGVRQESGSYASWYKRAGSSLFHKIMQRISHIKTVPSATDFRLLDRRVIDAFNSLGERNRITRGLIDWLGFPTAYILFKPAARKFGAPQYGFTKLFQLATHSFVSMSLLPLKLAGYLGMTITIVSGLMGLFIFVEKYLLHDPLGLGFSGPAILAVIILFLVGIILICLGLIALYIANIHEEVQGRPLYIIHSERP